MTKKLPSVVPSTVLRHSNRQIMSLAFVDKAAAAEGTREKNGADSNTDCTEAKIDRAGPPREGKRPA